jgi:Ca-activated chloride channel homolog
MKTTFPLIVSLLLGMLSTPAHGAAEQNRAVARAVRGTAHLSTDGGAKWRILKVGTSLQQGSVIRTDPGSTADLYLNENGPALRVTENSTVAIRTLTVDRTGPDNIIQTELELQAGRILGNVRRLAAASKYIIRFPSGNAEVRGTRYDISADGTVRAIEGTVAVTYRVNNTALEPIFVSTGQVVRAPIVPGEVPKVVNLTPTEISTSHLEIQAPAATMAAPSFGPGGLTGPSGDGGRGFFWNRSPKAQKPGFLDSSAEVRGVADADEVWVIKKYHGEEMEDGVGPGTGALLGREIGKEKEIPLPLRHTDVNASIRGYIASVNVTQKFGNPFRKKIEAVYIFPLPESAAVNEFLMMIGERRIRGIIREREEAEAIYEDAKRQGYSASLLTQERPNIFTQKVANIEPGKEIDISITYYHSVPFVDGWYEFVFPMVVGPRFNPPSSRGIGAVARDHSGKTGHRVEVSYLRPDERSGHDIRLNLEIDPGVPIEEYKCTTHAINTRNSSEALHMSLKYGDRIPNKDFVFRYRVAGETIKSSFVTHRSDSGSYFAFTIIPPRLADAVQRKPVELVFVIDCSGSMSGRPLEQAKAAVERGLKLLEPDDTFQLINFSLSAQSLSDRPLAATKENVRRALVHLGNLNSEGGTMMIEGIKAALDFPHDPRRLRYVCFLTDGFIGNEAEILSTIEPRLGRARIFSCGIGTSVNRYLLDSMAQVGKGVVAYIGGDDSAAEVMDLLVQRISRPFLADVEIDWGGLEVEDVYPKRIPDLFAGRSIIVTGRHKGDLPKEIRIQGTIGNSSAEMTLPIQAKTWNDFTALPAIWARHKIGELSATGGSENSKAIKNLALEYGLMSNYTAFLALDASRRTRGSESETVPVAVPVPERVKYNRTVAE